jgi:hypothetical protein
VPCGAAGDGVGRRLTRPSDLHIPANRLSPGRARTVLGLGARREWSTHVYHPVRGRKRRQTGPRGHESLRTRLDPGRPAGYTGRRVESRRRPRPERHRWPRPWSASCAGGRRWSRTAPGRPRSPTAGAGVEPADAAAHQPDRRASGAGPSRRASKKQTPASQSKIGRALENSASARRISEPSSSRTNATANSRASGRSRRGRDVGGS